MTTTPTETPACAAAHARAEAMLRPISAEMRAGRDARDDPRAELLRDEMLKDGYTRRDWSRIEDAARTLLSDTTKDLVVAAYWASAAYETDGLPGLAAGLSLLAGLLTDYWDDMLPPVARRKVRESAIENFYEHLGTRLQARTAGPDDGDDLGACTELLEALHRAGQTRYSPAPPSHRSVREALARLVASLPKPAPSTRAKSVAPGSTPTTPEPVPSNSSATAARPVPENSSALQSAPVPEASSAPAARPVDEASPVRTASTADDVPQAAPRAGASVEELTRDLGAAIQHLPKISAGLRRQQPEAPLPYRLLRIAVWLRAAEPSADPQGRSAVEPLPPTTRSQCDAMARAGRWPELLDASESAFAVPTQRFALDLQRHTATALANLGHHDARTAVLAELAALLHRMPGLPRLLARDGAPLADPDTLAFLARERLTPDLSPGPAPLLAPLAAEPPAPGLVSPVSQAMSFTPCPPSPVLQDMPTAPGPLSPVPQAISPAPTAPDLLLAARQRLAAGDRSGALAQLQQAADAATSPRQRFSQRIDLALLAHEAGLLPVARAQLTALEREAAERRLADWEPPLVARVLDPLLTILRGAPRPTDTTDTQRLFDLLCTLDPVAAARHSPR